jgi:hypothetical protein
MVLSFVFPCYTDPGDWRKRKAGERKENDCCECDVSILHKLNTERDRRLFQRIEQYFVTVTAVVKQAILPATA